MASVTAACVVGTSSVFSASSLVLGLVVLVELKLDMVSFPKLPLLLVLLNSAVATGTVDFIVVIVIGSCVFHVVFRTCAAFVVLWLVV